MKKKPIKRKVPRTKQMLTIKMSQLQAERLGIVFCTCGHPPNNHFDLGDGGCAHCECKKYDQHISLPENKEWKDG